MHKGNIDIGWCRSTGSPLSPAGATCSPFRAEKIGTDRESEGTLVRGYGVRAKTLRPFYFYPDPCCPRRRRSAAGMAARALPESVHHTACDELQKDDRKEEKGKRKREREEDIGMEATGKEKMEGMGKKKEKNGEEKLKKGKGGGILTNRLFSELCISELTAKAIREMNYTHLTKVMLLPLAKILPYFFFLARHT